MKLKEAIKRADEMRPNAISDELKANWVQAVEGGIAELMGAILPEQTFPRDKELLMPAPFDEVYCLYVCAMIDHVQQDSEMYYNDMTLYNALMQDARAYYRRHNTPKASGNWRGL